MESKWDEVHDLLTRGLYPPGYTKGQRQNLRRFASKFRVQDEDLWVGNKKAVKSRELARRLFTEFHSSPMGGHSGLLKTWTAISTRFYWNGMFVDIKKWISECGICQQGEKPLSAVRESRPIKVCRVWDVIGIDFIGPLPTTVNGYQYILAVTDYFSKWVDAFPLRSTSAAEVAICICSGIYKHGCPRHILSDQGREFVQDLNNRLLELLCIGKKTIVIYHPQTNAVDEKTNNNVKRALTKLFSDNQNDWDSYLEATLMSLQSKIDTSTNCSPLFLMYGREAVFPSQKPAEIPMAEVSADSVTLDLLREARETVMSSPLGVISTPMIPWCQTSLPLNVNCSIYIKLENMQKTGSFKIRGVANQFARRPSGGHFVTMSAGNYGKSFAYASKHYGSKGKVVMPETAPLSRAVLIQSFGVEVERVPTANLMDVVNRCVQEDNMTFLHSYDDLDLIAGHASLGFEVLEVTPEPDVVVVCCGGGGLLAGVAAAIKLSGCDETKIYGVEPEGACTMFRSFIEKSPVSMDTKSVASGLAPPFAGRLPFQLCQRYVEGIALVTDEEIKAAVSALYRSGLVVEPSGAAAFAAIVNNKIPKLEGKSVVCILSGGNIGKDELANIPD